MGALIVAGGVLVAIAFGATFVLDRWLARPERYSARIRASIRRDALTNIDPIRFGFRTLPGSRRFHARRR